MEGDILVEINNISVRKMCHSDVVQVLKDCASNKAATIMVERLSLSKSKKNDFKMGLYRVKTPTENCPLLMESTNSQKLSDCSSNSLKRSTDVYAMNNNNILQTCYSRSQSPGNELDLNENSWNRKRTPDSNYLAMSRNNNFYSHDDCSSRNSNNNEGYFYPVPNGQRKESTSFENEQPLPMNNDLR